MLRCSEAGVDRAVASCERAAVRLRKHRRRAKYYRRRLQELIDERMAREAAESGREHRRIDIGN